MPYGWLRVAALRDPMRAAIACAGHIVTYQELYRAASGLGSVLRGWGVGPGDTVAVQMGKVPEYVAALCALDSVGAAALMLDTALTAAEVNDYCSRAGAELVLTEPEAPAEPTTGLTPNAVPPVAELARMAGGPPKPDETPPRDPDSYFAMLMSSGTTGRPKIVAQTRRQLHALVRCLLAAAAPGGPGDRVLAVLPLFHASGLFKSLMGSLAQGCTLYLQEFSPRAAAEAIERHGITVMYGAPFIVNALVETEFSRTPDFHTLRLVTSGTAAQPRAAMREFRRRFGVAIALSYGATETGSTTMGLPPTDDPEPGWVGWPLPGIILEIRGSDGSCLPPGEEGEVFVRSPGTASCYLNDPEATAHTFRHDGVVTGDIGRLTSEGALCLTGRQKEMISVAGKKVAPAEVEAVLRMHPQVSEALVLPGRSGGGSEVVEAYVEARGGVTPGALRAFCCPRLAAYKVPRRFRIVDHLPRNTTGKVVRRPPDGTAHGDA